MTEQEQRIAIAEACGWHYVPGEEPTIGGSFKVAHWLSPTGERRVTDWHGKTDCNLPDYPHDLNAMHKAELTVQYDQVFHAIELRNIVTKQDRDDQDFDALEVELILHATAPQRAEAFLRTIGKWKD